MIFHEDLTQRNSHFSPNIDSLNIDELNNHQYESLKIFASEIADLDVYIQQEYLRLKTEANQKISSKNTRFNDFELDVEVHFFLNDNFIDHEDLTDNPAFVLLGSHMKSQEINVDEHCDRQSALAKNLGRHSALFHAIYDHVGLSWEQILQMGDYWIELKLNYQILVSTSKDIANVRT